MKITDVKVRTKEDLFEILDELDYYPSVFDSEWSESIMNKGDSLTWDLVEYVIERKFKDVLFFRSENPDLMKKFDEITLFFNRKNKEMKESYNKAFQQQIKERRWNT